MNVLIVDDDRLTVKCIMDMIDWEKLGIGEVFGAYGIRQAKEVMEREQIALLLCDIEMPGGSGYELLEWMAENSHHAATIFITSYARFDYAAKAIQMRVLDYILKPVSRENLEKSVKTAVAAVRESDMYYQWAKARDAGNAGVENTAVAQVKQYLEAHLEEDLNRDRLAKMVYLHPDYLTRIFKEVTGFSMMDYLTELRMLKAHRLLSKTDGAISEIAGKVGYADTSYFTRMFKRRFGVSPREFRKQEGRT